MLLVILLMATANTATLVHEKPFTVNCQDVIVTVDVNSSIPGWQKRVDYFPSGKVTAKGILNMSAYRSVGKEITFFVDVTPPEGPDGNVELPWDSRELFLLRDANTVNGTAISEESFVSRCSVPPQTFAFGGIWYIYIIFPGAAVILAAEDEETLYKMLDILYFEWKD